MKIVCLGDSITYGQVSYNWVKALARQFPQHQFVNHGVNGELAYNAFRRIDAVIAQKPDVVFVLLGTNDMFAISAPHHTARYVKRAKLPQVPTKEWYVENMDKILSTLRQKTQARIALISLPLLGEDMQHAANQMVKDYIDALKVLKEKHQCDWIPLHEHLVMHLLHHLPTRLVPLTSGLGLIVKAILRRFLLFQSWDNISKVYGLTLLTDTLHLNDTGGKILEQLVSKYLQA